MSYEVIEKTVFGVIVTKQERSCKTCKYFEKSFSWCFDNCECDTLERYLTEQEEQEYYSSKESAKLEAEIEDDGCTMDEQIIHSLGKEIPDSQKELIDLQIENKQLKERVNELEQTIENNTTELITEMDGVCGAVLYEITKTKCCGIAPITNENFCPNCGRKIVR